MLQFLFMSLQMKNMQRNVFVKTLPGGRLAPAVSVQQGGRQKTCAERLFHQGRE